MIEVTTGVLVPNRLRAIATLVAATILTGCAGIAALAEGVGPLVIAKQGYFFVGGRYMDQTGVSTTKFPKRSSTPTRS
jgi:hypothetical protein